jgi:hypothetical protein
MGAPDPSREIRNPEESKAPTSAPASLAANGCRATSVAAVVAPAVLKKIRRFNILAPWVGVRLLQRAWVSEHGQGSSFSSI